MRLLAELLLEALRRRRPPNVHMRDTAQMIRRRLFYRITDDDLGKSATGVVGRSGFERLLAAACAEEAGAIFAVEASRLARNGREWCTLLELCAVVDTVLIDTEAVYDPRSTSERLPLGLNGALSEPDWSVGVCGQVLIVEDVSSGGSCA